MVKKHDHVSYIQTSVIMGYVIKRLYCNLVQQILKDITNRYQVLQGNRVHYVPGWDCHGMPIELKALEDAIYTNQKLTPLQIRDKGI